MKKILRLSYILLAALLIVGCSTTRKKSDIKGSKKFYQNLTSKYNGFFNAQELVDETMQDLKLEQANNYNKVLPVYGYLEMDNPKAIAPDMDKAIEKVIKVATIHDLGDYVDDCYVLMGKAQFLKQDYTSAEETFQFFEEEFDPKNPYGREYTRAKLKKKSAKDQRKIMKEKQKESQDKRKDAEKEREEKRKKDKKARDAESEARKKKAKDRRKKSKKKSKKRTSTRTKKSTDEPDNKTERLTKEERQAQRDLEKEAAALKEEEARYAEEKAKLKEEEEEKKKAENRPQGEGGMFKNKTAFYEGLYWLARTYTETERFSSAKNILDRLETTEPLHEDVANRLPAAWAHLFMRTGDLDEAMLKLEEAIVLEKDKSLKARYAFIKAQLYEKKGSTPLAYTEYTRAKKFSPNYEMKFNATLNELKLSYRTKQVTKDKAISKLEKMANDAKNSEYLDQIYFTVAQVKLDSGDIDGAVADFNQAISASGGNKNVKLEAYYKLAELLYAQAYYREAKTNYDAALKMMPLTDDRYKEVKRLAEGLVDVAANIEIVETQDSLKKMSLMTEDELRELAIENIEAQRAAGIESAAPQPKRQANVFASGANRSMGSNRSSFFAYNQQNMAQGIKEFKRTWGDRILEDNWRRSLRTDANISEASGLSEEEEEIAEITEQEISEYLRNIPSSELQKKTANVKIQNALFELGILFRERLRNNEKAIEVLERLVREYPEFVKRDEALFYLYLCYQDAGDNNQATLALNKLKTEFPDSQFTKLAVDPSYAADMKSKETNIDAFYARTYDLFESGQYLAVLKRAEEKGNLFKQNAKYDPKFDLLVAMSNGNLQGKEKYINDLKSLILRHKNTPEEVKAKEILRFLKGDSQAFDKILYDEGKDNFSLDDNKLHYAFVVVYNQKNLDDIKIAISDYNKKYHKLDNLKISNIPLNVKEKSEVVLIRSFSKKTPAMEYYKGVLKNQIEFVTRQNIEGAPTPEFDIFLATQKNYREVVKEKSVLQYRAFFERHYKTSE